MSFIHLRVASAFSMKYGTTQPGDLVEQAREYAMPALALTDRATLSGAIRFAKASISAFVSLMMFAISMPPLSDIFSVRVSIAFNLLLKATTLCFAASLCSLVIVSLFLGLLFTLTC